MPEILEKRVDFPTLGRPTKATTGTATLTMGWDCSPQDEHIPKIAPLISSVATLDLACQFQTQNHSRVIHFDQQSSRRCSAEDFDGGTRVNADGQESRRVRRFVEGTNERHSVVFHLCKIHGSHGSRESELSNESVA